MTLQVFAAPPYAAGGFVIFGFSLLLVVYFGCDV